MADELEKALAKTGLVVNGTKTMAMATKPDIISVGGQNVKHVDKVIYLGVEISLSGKQRDEVQRRIRAGTFSFNRYRDLFTNKLVPIPLKRKLFHSCVLPSFTYACETWAITIASLNNVRYAQRRLERVMLGISLLDHRRNEWVRERTGLRDIAQECMKRKWSWCERIANMADWRWARAVVEWVPQNWKRGRGNPGIKWKHDFTKAVGDNFLQMAQNKKIWKEKFLELHG